MRPFRSFLLLLIFLIIFAGLSYIFPWDINLPSVETLIPKELLPSLFKGNEAKNIDPDAETADTLQNVIQASAVITDSIPFIQPAADSAKFLFGYVRPQGEQIRILYYGDSQIEGDRITSFLRHSLRKDYGGSGPGLFLPLMPVTYTRSIYVRSSTNWRRYNYLSFEKGEITHTRLGPFMAFCRYLPEGEISSGKIKSWIRIMPSILADSSTSRFEFLRIFYRNSAGPVTIEVRADNNPVVSDTLDTGAEISEFRSPLYNSKNILIDFSGKSSPDIYGISIESSEGIIIDNIPQRGSAGLEFTMIDTEDLRETYRLLAPDIIVLHYGLNIVKNIRNNYSYYEKGLSRQISLLKEIVPASGFLVVGITDMAYAEGDVIKSYPNIHKIIAAQKMASEESGAVFWDAFKAMGGDSSIIKWFRMNPPLAKKDFVHFTEQGADTLARMMVSELFARRERDSSGYYSEVSQKDTVSQPPTVITPVKSEVVEKQGLLKLVVTRILNYDPVKPFIFSAPAFWIFFLLVLAGYSLFYKRLTARNIYLFLVSLFFYYKTGGLFLFILIFVTVVDYACGILMNRTERKGTRKFFLLLSIVSNLGLLAYFKYTGFIVEALNNLFGTQLKVVDLLSSFSNSILGTSFDISYIILPVGISFFTFQSLSYTIDVYRRKMEPVRNIVDFGFYVSFFPHLVAGPIVRASVFIPQIYQEFRLSQREFSHALFMISKGLVKKIIISNFIAVNLVDKVFDLPASFSGFENLMAVYGYGMQIYCDFSGYTDIAIGVALILGFRLPVNFNSPYKAVNIADFWKRWHISLSQWLRDYLYISMGGNRKGRFRTILNLMITMLLGGLWHGADLRFIIWGGLHGIGLAINKIMTFIFGEISHRKQLLRVLSIFVTFQFVSFCWIFFRAPDMHSVGLIFRQIFGNFLPSSFDNFIPAYAGVLSLMTAGYIIHFLPERLKETYRGFFIKIPVAAQMAIILLIAFTLYQMSTTEVMPFIYFRF